MTESTRKEPTPILITFHCGIYLVLYVSFVMSLGRQDVVDFFNQIAPTYIRDMLVIQTLTCVGYFGMWAFRRWGLAFVGVGGLLMNIVFIYHTQKFNPFFLVPIVAALTTAPMWPIMKKGL